MGTPQPAELSVRTAQLLSGLARRWNGSWIAVLHFHGAMPSVSPSPAPTETSPAAGEVLHLALWEQQALQRAIFPPEEGSLALLIPLGHSC